MGSELCGKVYTISGMVIYVTLVSYDGPDLLFTSTREGLSLFGAKVIEHII